MKIIEPKVELWIQDDPIVHVAKCARVCYGSPTQGKSTAEQLYNSLLKAKHNSMFRHESVYAIIPTYQLSPEQYRVASEYANNSPYIDVIRDDKNTYIATNRNFMIDHYTEVIYAVTEGNRVTPEHFANTEIGHSMMRYTFDITTQISTSRELNRKSPNCIAERSTRYCYEDGAIVRPHWISKEDANKWEHLQLTSNTNIESYLRYCETAFDAYKDLNDEGVLREDARGVLPLDTATNVVYTYSVKEWRDIINLRTSKRAHPNCRIVCNMIKQHLEELGYDFAKD